MQNDITPLVVEEYVTAKRLLNGLWLYMFMLLFDLNCKDAACSPLEEKSILYN